VHAALCQAVADGNVGFLLDFREGRIEVLRVVVVEYSGLAVVFTHNRHKSANIYWLPLGFLALDSTASTKTRSVSDAFFTTLLCVLLSFNREI